MIELTVVGANQPALVDDSMAHLVGYRWRVCKGGYVYRKVHGKRRYLHHFVLPGDRWPDFVRDHINRNKFDNQLANLRWVTLAENTHNRTAHRCNVTGLRGVLKIGERYRATVTKDGVVHRFGMFDTAEEAGDVTATWRAQNMPLSPEGAGV